MSDIASIAAKLAKLIPCLSSEHDGEVVATVQAIIRTLKSVDRDLHTLAELVRAVSQLYPNPLTAGEFPSQFRTIFELVPN